MESLAKTLNAPKEIELGGKTYKISALTLNDLADYEVYLKKVQCKSLTELDIPKKEMYAEIVKINNKSIDPDELVAGFQTMTGLRWLWWRVIHNHDDEVTIDSIAESVSMDRIGDIAVAFELGDDDKKSEGKNTGKK
jgi:hypothetical protein